MRMHGRGRRRETSGTMKKAVAVPDLRSRAIFTLVSALLAARVSTSRRDRTGGTGLLDRYAVVARRNVIIAAGRNTVARECKDLRERDDDFPARSRFDYAARLCATLADSGDWRRSGSNLIEFKSIAFMARARERFVATERVSRVEEKNRKATETSIDPRQLARQTVSTFRPLRARLLAERGLQQRASSIIAFAPLAPLFG